MLKIKSILAIFLVFITVVKLKAQQKRNITMADPTVFYYDKTYYLYGTLENSSDEGFKVYTSKDKINWEDRGVVLKKSDTYGSKGFWAPQVFKFKQKFYMAFVADENIGFAVADSPLGPFKQKNKQAIAAPVKIIDPFVFFDGGKIYLYHVRLINGNRIFVAEMNEDLSAIKEETLKECISASKPWENTENAEWRVTEGPTVLKRNKLYYLFYSANDFRNKDYAVGYATSIYPVGPWKKHGNEPVLSLKQTNINGSGHGDFFINENGNWEYVFHTHESNEKVGKRKTALISAKFVKAKNGEEILITAQNTFKYLMK